MQVQKFASPLFSGAVAPALLRVRALSRCKPLFGRSGLSILFTFLAAFALSVRAAGFLFFLATPTVAAASSFCFSLASFFAPFCRRASSRRIFFLRVLSFIMGSTVLRLTRLVDLHCIRHWAFAATRPSAFYFLLPNFFCYRSSMSIALKETPTPSPATMMSIEEIRRCFPALARNHSGYPVAYFDGPGGTQVPRTV